ncbi:murein L,D-transpeptidase catalytic domain-containing protein [Flavobacterium sp.]|uniref:murein L,D-transpeptidase catalytic domain-containing protein n=1 Tax=Flavobacterium sp. TaxID=239 RepID=UPI0039E542D2
MKNALLIVFISFICCNNAIEEVPRKDYATQHQQALAYCRQKGFNDDYYFLVDLSVHSGKNRFFVYDFKKQRISNENLVTHGSCDVLEDNKDKWEKAKFSNANNSHCSAKGKYKIGKRDYSGWGIKVKYWLHGLEPTNSNAEQRVVVLHSWSAVANEEIFPDYAPLSWGCPAVSDDFMRTLDTKLQATDKPVLLWIIE